MTTDPQLAATMAAAQLRTEHDRQRHTGDTRALDLMAQLSTR